MGERRGVSAPAVLPSEGLELLPVSTEGLACAGPHTVNACAGSSRGPVMEVSPSAF